MANGKVCKPGARGDGYGGYYLALVVKDIDLDPSAIYTFKFTPYMKRNNGEIKLSENSYKVTVFFENNQIKILY